MEILFIVHKKTADACHVIDINNLQNGISTKVQSSAVQYGSILY